MGSYGERAFSGPDAWGRTFKAEPCQHCAAWEERKRLALIEARNRAAWRTIERRTGSRARLAA